MDDVQCLLPGICNVTNYPNYCAYNPFGPNADCTLDVCCPEFSAYAYIPDLTSNAAFLAVFAVAMLVHVLVGLIWNQWWFMCCMVAGCVDEILGYAGRVWMNQDLWSFNAFMIQVGELQNSCKYQATVKIPESITHMLIRIVCITTAPVFFCAAIYVLLAKTQVTTSHAPSLPNQSGLMWIF